MDNLTINWREELINLFPDTTERTKGENDEWCPKCKGIGLINEGNYIVGCTNCYGKGFIKACECGNKIEHKGYTACQKCRGIKASEKEKEQLEKAKKIPFKDYEGLFLWNERAITKECLEEELYSLIYDGEKPPQHIYATVKEKVFYDINLTEIVQDKCEEGYEDMCTYFDYKDEDFLQAQELVNKWLSKHESILDIYTEDFGTVVLLDSVVQEIREQIASETGKKEAE